MITKLHLPVSYKIWFGNLAEERFRTLMAIFVERKMTDEDLTRVVPEQDKLLKEIARTWQESRIKHNFEDEGHFKKALRRNLKTLDFPATIEALFRPAKWFFSTQANGRLETLYFKNKKHTGRLRQQHPKGPLAKIDKKAREHLFLSEERFHYLKKWHKKHKHRRPNFKPSEERPKTGKYHIELAYDGKKISKWHASEGRVKMNRQNLERRVASALQNILGVESV